MATRRPGASASPAEDTVSVPEAAARLHLQKSRAYELIRLKKFPIPDAELVRVGAAPDGTGGRVRVPVAALERALGLRPRQAAQLAPADRAVLLDALVAALPGALAAAMPEAIAVVLRQAVAGEGAR